MKVFGIHDHSERKAQYIPHPFCVEFHGCSRNPEIPYIKNGTVYSLPNEIK